MVQPNQNRRIEIVEEKLDALATLPDRAASLETSVTDFRTEVRAEFAAVRSEARAEFAAVRSEARAEFAAVREEIRAGDEETRRQMRVLHEDVIDRIARLGERFPEPRTRNKRPKS